MVGVGGTRLASNSAADARATLHAVVGGDVRLGGRWRLAADLAAMPWRDSVMVDWDTTIHRSVYVRRRLLVAPFSAVLQHVHPVRSGHRVLRVGVPGFRATQGGAASFPLVYSYLRWMGYASIAFPLAR